MNATTGANGQLFGWSEATWLWLDQFGILLGLFLACVTIAGGFAAWLSRDRFRRWVLRGSLPVTSETAEDTVHWDGLLFTVSRIDLPLWILRTRKPEAIALMATEASLDSARRIAEEARKQGTEVVGQVILGDPDDPVVARAQATQLLQRLQESGCEKVAADVTGGKTPMSIGAFLAAGDTGADVLYVVSEYDRKLKQPVVSSAQVRCILRARENGS